LVILRLISAAFSLLCGNVVVGMIRSLHGSRL